MGLQGEKRTTEVRKMNGELKQKLAEHKGTEEAVRQSEARYRTLVENVRDVIYTISEDAVISSLNPAFERITGWSRSEWIGKPLQSIVHPGDWPKELELLERMLEGETPPAHEVRVRSKSGEYWTGEFMITPLFQEGRFAGVLGVGRDISERKRIERELRIKENSIDLSVSAISLADLGGNLTYVNPAFLKLWGYNDEKEILGKPVAKFWYTEEQAQVVVHGIVRSTGGTIAVDSKLGERTAIHVFFPRIRSKVTAEARVLSPFPSGNEQILFVDDEKALVDIGVQLLEHLGYRVVARTSSIEALEAFRSQPEKFDLVMSDQTMPNMTGEMLAKELIRIRPDIPIVLCTGYSEMITEEKATALGIKKLIMKPILMREMSETIRQILDQRHKNET